MEKKYFPPRRDINSLALRDLLEAREAYHVHLAHLENVIATAIGRFRIRVTDPDAKEPVSQKKWRSRKSAPERTLSNSVVKPWSWPCLLVFLGDWEYEQTIASKHGPGQVVPPYLYLPDGRVVPTCTVKVEKQEVAPPPLLDITFPDHLIGGGYPVFTRSQQQQRIGSLGCLVTDGDSVYALTNRHVTGEEHQPVFSIVGGKEVEIGKSSRSRLDQRSALGKKLFKDVYPGWPALRAYANLDAGLVHINDLSYWTSQVFGVGEIDDPVDLNIDTISLDLIGCPVRAFGAASGEMFGEIHALFYRYKAVGGFEYISDLLIGPRTDTSREYWLDDEKAARAPAAAAAAELEQKQMRTRPGDSGTVWFFDKGYTSEKAKAKGEVGKRARRLRPIALQWGGHTLLDEGGESQTRFALATCLSTICRELDLDILADFNIAHSEYWGKTGHYKIAAKACQLVANSKLRKLLLNNVENIAFGDEAIEAGELKKVKMVKPSEPNRPFVPLADVPDLVWRSTRKKDEANHFADMDEKGKGPFKGKTLLQLCQDPANVDIPLWNSFYDSLDVNFKRGALPFRVWQLYKQMVASVKAGKVAEFICAGGTISHYVGDACQPLHVSHLHHGRNKAEENVHSVYETQMLDRFATEVIALINQELQGRKARADVKGGHEAAVSVVELMRETIKKLPPVQVLDAFNNPENSNRIQGMWNKLGKRTAACMALGCLRLGSLWSSAWREGGGDKKIKNLGEVDRGDLRKLYENKSFLPAFRLQEPEFAAAL